MHTAQVLPTAAAHTPRPRQGHPHHLTHTPAAAWLPCSFLRSGGGGMAQPRRPANFHSHYAALHSVTVVTAAPGNSRTGTGSKAGASHAGGARSGLQQWVPGGSPMQ